MSARILQYLPQYTKHFRSIFLHLKVRTFVPRIIHAANIMTIVQKFVQPLGITEVCHVMNDTGDETQLI